MGKEKKENIDEQVLDTPPFAPKKKKKKKWPIFVVIILIGAALIFFFKKPILNIVRDLPFIGQFVGDDGQEEHLSPEELQVKVSAQEKEIEELKNQLLTLQGEKEALETKNASLKQYESMYTDFIEQKNAWDEEVAKTNTNLFIEQFEKTYPDNAERIYGALKGKAILSEAQKQVATTVGTMEEDKAAAALEKLLKTDSELIKVIFEGMSKDRQAAILSEMSSDAAAQVIKLISPDEPFNE